MSDVYWPPGTRSMIIDADGPTHLLDFGGRADAPGMLCLHGFGGSAANWGLVGPDLASDFRVRAPDLVGHGLTPAKAHPPTVDGVLAQVEALLGTDRPAYVVGGSFGGAVALMLAERAPTKVAGVVVIDAPMPNRLERRVDPVMAAKRLLISMPGVAHLILKRTTAMTPRQVVEEQLRAAGSDPATVDSDAVDAAVASQQTRHGDRQAHRAQQRLLRSLLRVFEHGTRYRLLTRRVSTPVLWLHGERDPLVSVASARSFAGLHPGWELRTHSSAGHVPYLDDPAWVTAAIRGWDVVTRDLQPMRGQAS